MVSITDREFQQLTEYIKRHYGIHMKAEKRTLLTGRLQHVLQQRGYNSFSDFFDYIQMDKTGKALADLADKVTTNHTFFMRETDHFDFFKQQALPQLMSLLRNKDIRIWSAGCSSGQEPYTLAMLLADYFGKSKSEWDTKILATDISSGILEQAIKGQYPNEQIEKLPPRWRTEFFVKQSNQTSMISDKLKSEVIFRKFNLMEPVFPFKKKFHIIFCRNVMIYFDNPTKDALIQKFWEQLEYGGYLFIGHSESINRDKTKFRYLMPALYRKE